MTRARRLLPYLCAALLPLLAASPRWSGLAPGERVAVAADLGSGFRVPAIEGWPSIDPNAALTLHALGGLAARDWLRGEVPWWNPYEGVGLPLAAEMQPAALFLPFNLLLAAPAGLLMLRLAMQCLAAATACGVARQLGASGWAAGVCGALYGCNGMFAWFADAPMLPLAFLPPLLLGIEWARDARPAKGIAIIAVAVAGSLYAGFPETAYLDGLLALAWAVVRLVRAERRSRLAFSLALGVAGGVMMAAPVLLPFLELLRDGYAGHAPQPGQSDVIARPTISGEGLPTLLFPTVYGPLAPTPVPGLPAVFNTWLGGPFGCVLLVGTLAGLLGRRERALRVALGLFLAASLCVAAGLPILGPLLWRLPLLDLVLVPRYVVGACAMAGAVLTALALDDWRAGRPGGVRWAALSWTVLTAAALVAGEATLSAAIGLGRAGWALGSILVGVGLGLTLLAVLARRWRPAWAALATTALLAEAGGACLIPSLSGFDADFDAAAPDWLADHLGLNRFFTLGPVRPNYGALFGIAQINSEYRPVPLAWAAHIRSLDPTADVVQFRGESLAAAPDAEAILRSRLDRFTADGVRYIVTRHATDPFMPETRQLVVGAVARDLGSGESIGGALRGFAGHAAAVSFRIGTYLGTARGMLAVRLCGAAGCAEGSADLAVAGDDEPLRIRFAAPLPVASGEVLRWSARHDGPGGVALWLGAPQPGGLTVSVDGEDGAPEASIVRAAPEDGPVPVHEDAILSIYEVPNAAAYFEAVGCAVTARTRTAAALDCAHPSTLIRRELAWPGWTATVNGAPAALVADGLFQTIAVPAGHAEARFAYAPPGIAWACAAAAAGLAMILAPFGLRRRTPMPTPSRLRMASAGRHA